MSKHAEIMDIVREEMPAALEAAISDSFLVGAYKRAGKLLDTVPDGCVSDTLVRSISVWPEDRLDAHMIPLEVRQRCRVVCCRFVDRLEDHLRDAEEAFPNVPKLRIVSFKPSRVGVAIASTQLAVEWSMRELGDVGTPDVAGAWVTFKVALVGPTRYPDW